MTSQTERTKGGDDADFEALLMECIDAFSNRGAAGVTEFCDRNPQHAERLRGRLASLQRLGLLGAEAEDAGPQTIGGYEILRQIGRGGMAVVYLAREPAGGPGAEPGRLVALKSSSTPLSGDERARIRFQREIRAFEGLRHPNVVPVLDSGEEQGRPFFTMEYVEGATLAEVIRSLRDEQRSFDELTGRDLGRIAATDRSGPGELHSPGDQHSPAETARGPEDSDVWARSYFETVTRVVLQVAEALEHVHEHGVLHRDVKPSNVLLRLDGRALLFDLGLAHVDDQPALTRSGDFAGTPYYVSPEQVARGPKDLDARSDVYSLGVTLFELLTLRRPFEGASTAQVLRSIAIDEPPLPRRFNPLVPRGLETICLTAMEKDPERRYGSAAELAADLRRFLDFKPVQARPVGALRRGVRFVRRHPALSAALALAGLLLIGVPIGLAVANRAIREQRNLATVNAESARRQVDRNARQIEFLVELFDATEAAFASGEVPRARDVIDRSAKRIDVQFKDDRLVHAALLEATGRVYANLGLYERAIQQLDRSFSLLQRDLGEHHVDVASALQVLAETHLAAGNHADAEALARRGLASLGRAEAKDPKLELRGRLTLADALIEFDRRAEARAELGAAAALADSGDDRADVEERVARLALKDGELGEARRRLEAALELRETSSDPDFVALVRTLEALAATSEASGSPDESEAFARRAEALRGTRAGFGAVDLAARGERDGSVTALFERFLLLPAWMRDYDEFFQSGVTALQSGRWYDAVDAFQRCQEWRPRHPTCSYNIACAYALLGESETAMDWLERAVADGMAAEDMRWDAIQRDLDLEGLRGTARYKRLLEETRSDRAAFKELVSRPVFRTPASGGAVGREDGRPDAGWPLLVVLHADGEHGPAVAAGSWARLADELGFALLAPTGSRSLANDPSKGMRWFDDVRELLRLPGLHGQAALDGVEACLTEHPIDPDRVYIAGEGEAGPLAFDLALRAPGRFRGVVIWNGTVLPGIDRDRLRRAAVLGLGVTQVIDRPGALAGDPDLERLRAHRTEVETLLRGAGLAAEIEVHPPPLDLAESEARLIAGARKLLSVRD